LRNATAGGQAVFFKRSAADRREISQSEGNFPRQAHVPEMKVLRLPTSRLGPTVIGHQVRLLRDGKYDVLLSTRIHRGSGLRRIPNAEYFGGSNTRNPFIFIISVFPTIPDHGLALHNSSTIQNHQLNCVGLRVGRFQSYAVRYAQLFSTLPTSKHKNHRAPVPPGAAAEGSAVAGKNLGRRLPASRFAAESPRQKSRRPANFV